MAVKHYDVVIAGGAMAGATLGLALEKMSRGVLSIAIVEPFSASSDSHPGFDSRSIALSYGTSQILDGFGLWKALRSEAMAIDSIHVSDKGHAGMTDIDKHDYAVDALGYVVELANVGQYYHHRINNSKSIDLLCPDSVVQLEPSEEKHRITLKSGEKIDCSLLVAADGAISQCCQLMGIENREQDFEQVAVIANVLVSEEHQGRAYERFTKSGPLAMLPMTDNRMSLVWCLSPHEADKMMSVSDSEFLSVLQREFGWRLGHLLQAGSRASYPLVLREKSRIISHRFATVGNAAQTLHPIAGQGFNLGIRDVASLAEEILSGEDAGAYSVLSKYHKRREPDRRSTINLTAGLVHIFSNDWLPMVAGRNLSLMAIDNMSMIKEPLLRRTMGLVRR